MDSDAATDERGWCVRQYRVVLTPRRWRQVRKEPTLRAGDGGKKAVRRGDDGISRKAIAQGRPDALRWTCMLVCALAVHIAHETAGAARTRSSLYPLFEEGTERYSKARANLSRDREATLRAGCLPYNLWEW